MSKNRLVEIRQKKRVTQSEVAIGTGLSQEQISKYESGRVIPSLDSAIALASYYDVSLDYLAGVITSEQDTSMREFWALVKDIPAAKRSSVSIIISQISKLCNS